MICQEYNNELVGHNKYILLEQTTIDCKVSIFISIHTRPYHVLINFNPGVWAQCDYVIGNL